MSKIISIGTAVPHYGTQQSHILEFMQKAYNDTTASRKLDILFHYSGIHRRYSVIPDFDMSLKDHLLFGGKQTLPVVEERLHLFKEYSVPLAMDAVYDSLGKIEKFVHCEEITHLITVTCTGLYAPGIEIELMNRLNLSPDTYHTSVNFLGCNAAFHALKIADMIAKNDENAKVLMVCVELCTLHFQPKNNTDNLLANTIFGDGAAALIITSDKFADQRGVKGFYAEGFYSMILNGGKELMEWNINSVNFEMVLSDLLPGFIGDDLPQIVSKATTKWNIEPEDIDIWAVHPGGKRILDTVRKKMHMPDDDLQSSYNVLEQYGNMSSPTILFVLNEILQQGNLSDKTVFAIGFGPGLSIETALLRYV